MADSIGPRPGTSDEYHDPFCEPCEESRGKNVKVECFCKGCNQYLCTDCYTTHKSLRASRGHAIQTGDDMPKSMADKPPRYDTCDDHPKHLMDQFCFDHGILVCSTCCNTIHISCDTKSVADTCQYVQQSEVDNLCNNNKTYKSQLMKFLSSVDKHGGKLTEQKKTMLKDAQTMYDKLLAEINRGYQNIKTAIHAEYNSQEATVSQLKQGIKAQMTQADEEINFTNKVKGKTIDVNAFLRLQDSVNNMRESVAAVKRLKDSAQLRSLIFEPSKDAQGLSESLTFGSVSKPIVDIDANISNPEMRFPVKSLRNIQVKQLRAYNVSTNEDKESCFITGIAITPSGLKLLVDHDNQNVKLFSKDMGFLSSLSMPGRPWDITMVNDREAVATVGRRLVFLSIADRRLRDKDTINLSFDTYGICHNNDVLFVTTGPGTNPTQVRALDLQGRELWSVRQSLFENARYICSNSDGRWVAVTDHRNTSVTLLDTTSGSVIARKHLEKNRIGKWLLGVSVDKSGNIFVCGSIKIVALTENLKSEKVLFNLRDKWLKAIAYDETNQQITISYGENGNVSCLQLS